MFCLEKLSRGREKISPLILTSTALALVDEFHLRFVEYLLAKLHPASHPGFAFFLPKSLRAGPKALESGGFVSFDWIERHLFFGMRIVCLTAAGGILDESHCRY